MTTRPTFKFFDLENNKMFYYVHLINKRIEIDYSEILDGRYILFICFDECLHDARCTCMMHYLLFASIVLVFIKRPLLSILVIDTKSTDPMLKRSYRMPTEFHE